MIQVGDLVRFKNSALKASNIMGLFGRTRWKKYKRFRGKQRIAKVLSMNEEWDWKTRRYNKIVVLDIPDMWGRYNMVISAHYLVLHRKQQPAP
jgi:hypothetical protein